MSKASSGARKGPQALLRAYYHVSRLEYLPAEAPALLVPLLLGTTTVAGLLNFQWLEAVVTFALLYTSGFIINSYNDIEVDLRWKTRVADGAKTLRRRTLLYLFIAQTVAASLLALHLSIILNAWFLLALVLLGVFFSTAYSLPPLHLKVRGVWHIISLSFSAFTLPFLFFVYVVMHAYSLPILVFILGFTVAHYGIALANQTGDYLEDKAEGLSTPAVKWGLDRTLKLAKVMTLTGFIIILAGLYGFIESVPWLGKFETATAFLPFPGRYALIALITVLLAAGYSVPTRGLFSLHSISGQKASIEKRMDAIKLRLNYPRWQASGIWSLTLVSGLLYAFAVVF
jgi:4-hydroxybenzoate polyprenyltransferase